MKLPLLWRAAAGVQVLFGAFGLFLAFVLFVVGTVVLSLLVLLAAIPVGMFVGAFKLKEWSERHA